MRREPPSPRLRRLKGMRCKSMEKIIIEIKYFESDELTIF